MPENTPAQVIVAAGGLGTRVHGWAQFIPKEFYPVGGRPGITRLLDEISALGPARVAIIYHPYYEQFAAWGREVLGPDGHARYSRVAGVDVAAAVPAGTTVSLIPQHGPYGDLTSVFNGADRLAAGNEVYIAFADNLYSGPAPLPLLGTAPSADVSVLASRYQPELAGSRGILITRPGEPPQVQGLVEKPDPAQAAELEDAFGRGNLMMLEGRAKVTAKFLDFARTRYHSGSGNEPKLALAIDAYAREHRVVAVPAPGQVIDLGASVGKPGRPSASTAGVSSPATCEPSRCGCREGSPRFTSPAGRPG